MNPLRIVAIVLLFVAILGRADEEQIVTEGIDRRFDQHREIAHQIWEYAELGYQEERSSTLLKETLRDAGFQVKAPVAGIPTAFIASAGTGQPIIALLAEYDALPGITQTASPTRQPIPEKEGGHACGHHLFGAASVGAGIALKDWLETSGTAGTIRVYGTPAEEGGSGKVYMVRAGLFDDVDAVLAWHPSDRNRAQSSPSLANRSAKFRFHGVSAHAAGAPEKARSALDGVEAFNYMANLLREHVPQQTRIHYVITSGGKAPNVVPDFAEVFYYVRHPDAGQLVGIWDRLTAAATGAASGTGTTVDWEIIHGNHSMLPNDYLAELLQTKLERVGGVHYDAGEQAFAETLYQTLDQPQLKLGTEEEVEPLVRTLRMGSTDVGDISWNVPTAHLSTATWVPGTSAHSWQAIAAGGTTIGIKGLQVAAKTLSLTAMELYRNPDHVAEAKRELLERRGPGFVYECLLGDREPPLDYRE